MASEMQVALTLRDQFTKDLSKAQGQIRSFTAKVSASFTKVTRLPQLLAVTGFGFLTKSLIDAAASIELFNVQLEATIGTAEEADKALTAIREFAKESPLETEDVVQSYVRLRAVGIDPTIQQMETFGGVAVLFNRKMADISEALISGEKEVLRRLGVEIDRTGAKAIISSGNVRREVGKDMASIRGAILDVWAERFPNAIETASDTTIAKSAIMKSEIFELATVIGEKLKPAWDGVLEAVSKVAKATREFLSPQEEQQRLANIKAGSKALEQQEAVLTRVKIALAEAETGAGKAEASRVEALRAMVAEIEGIIDRNSTVLTQMKESKKELEGTGALGAGETETEQEKERKRRAAERSAKAVLAEEQRLAQSLVALAFEEGEREIELLKLKHQKELTEIGTNQEAKELAVERHGIELALLEEKVARERDEKKEKQEEKHAAAILEAKRGLANATAQLIAEEGAREIELLRVQQEIELQDLGENEEAKTLLLKKHLLERQQLERKNAQERKEDDQEAADSRFNTSMKLTQALLTMAATAVDRTRGERKKELRMLRAIAIAQGAASAVTAAKAGWDTGTTYFDKIGLAIAGVVQAGTIAGGQIATINAQLSRLARGTSFARGGLALVGEEGPEMVNLPRGAGVQTAAQTRQSFGGTTIAPTVIIQGNATEATVQKIDNTLRDFAQNFNDGIRRGFIDLARAGIAAA
jgi:hypothetical protein